MDETQYRLVFKYRADFPAVYLIVLTFVLATKYSWQKKKIVQTSQLTVRERQYAIEYVGEITNSWAIMIWSSSKWYRLLIRFWWNAWEDLPLWSTSSLTASTTPCLRDVHFHHCYLRWPTSPWEIWRNDTNWNQTSSPPFEDVNVVQAWWYLASRRSGRESR